MVTEEILVGEVDLVVRLEILVEAVLVVVDEILAVKVDLMVEETGHVENGRAEN